MGGGSRGGAVTKPSSQKFFVGWRVVGAAFVFAVFAWGIAFYGPIVQATGTDERFISSGGARRPT
jgi:hypothetical protein